MAKHVVIQNLYCHPSYNKLKTLNFVVICYFEWQITKYQGTSLRRAESSPLQFSASQVGHKGQISL